MVMGITFTSGYIVYFQFLGGSADQYLFGITPEGIGFIGMLINFLTAFCVSAFTAKIPAEVAAMVDEIHVPTSSGIAQDHEI